MVNTISDTNGSVECNVNLQPGRSLGKAFVWANSAWTVQAPRYKNGFIKIPSTTLSDSLPTRDKMRKWDRVLKYQFRKFVTENASAAAPGKSALVVSERRSSERPCKESMG